MLNVDRILVFLCIGVFSSSLYAVDVSKFDIKGIVDVRNFIITAVLNLNVFDKYRD